MIEINEQGYNPKEKRVAVNECLTKIVRERRMAVSWKRKVLLQQKQLKKKRLRWDKRESNKSSLCVWKFVFVKISQYLQESICVGDSF